MDVTNTSTRLSQYIDGYRDYAVVKARECAIETAKYMKEHIPTDAGLSRKIEQRFVLEAMSQEIMAMFIANAFRTAYLEEMSDVWTQS